MLEETVFTFLGIFPSNQAHVRPAPVIAGAGSRYPNLYPKVSCENYTQDAAEHAGH